MENHQRTIAKTVHTDNAKANEFIIAIGASAGGMEAIHTLFDHTPSDDVAYVIIQHLSPDHKSFMAELLVKHSKLKIYEVENNMEVQSNCIYVMPGGKDMTIVNRKLILKKREPSTPNSAVDIFFNSLAEDYGNRSVGIVLSGNGSDGTKGIAAIKNVGGMVIIQDPHSTEYKSMPENAIESGYYDYVLSPELIPQQIINYIRQRTLSKNFSEPISPENEAEIEEVIEIVKKFTPLDFSNYKRPTIVRRIVRRIIAKGAGSLNDYIKLLNNNTEEVEILSKEFLISVTRFFRDPKAFDVIKDKVLPELISNKLLVDTLKVWVVGCATGEEAYSLAILIKEHLLEMKKDIEVKIFASDIDRDALAKAAKGCYSENIRNDVSEERLNAFFSKEGNEYKVRDNIRNMIIFANHDIVHQPPYAKIDLISCRNLLIYMNPTLQKKIFSTLHFCLNVGGYLFIGPSEGIGEFKGSFEEADKKWKIYKNIVRTKKLGLSSYSPQTVERKHRHNPLQDSKSSKSNLPDNLLEIVSLSHLSETGFEAAICIDGNNKIIQPIGQIEKFLIPKLLVDNLLELLPPELSLAVGASIKESVIKDIKISVAGINYKINDAIRSVKIVVKPFLPEKPVDQTLIIIYFADDKINKDVEGKIEVFNKESYESKYISLLEKEMAQSNKKLSEAYSTIDDSNENVQSYNEELISGNEEMQSANEELQSINEELNTVNSEYQLKIKELADLWNTKV